MTKCPKCQRENDPDAQICVYCGEPLVDLSERISTRGLDDTDYEEGTPKWGSARFGSRANLLIGVGEEINTFVFDANQIEELVMGRRDVRSGDVPEVDLYDYEAVEKGVSRHHALIVRRDGSLYLVDNDSANGTFLNGQRLVAQQPRVLRDGDDIRLGHLTLRVTFEGIPTPKTDKELAPVTLAEPPVPASKDLKEMPSVEPPESVSGEQPESTSIERPEHTSTDVAESPSVEPPESIPPDPTGEGRDPSPDNQ